MRTYTIKVTENVIVKLTAKQLEKLHDSLTQLYNDNYEEITSETNPE